MGALKPFPLAGIKWALILMAAASVAGTLAWVSGSDDRVPATAAITPARALPVADSRPAAGRSAAIPAGAAASIIIDQQDAAAAATAQLGRPHVAGGITQRPDFVSEVEWQALQNVASQSPQPAVALGRLANKLLFAKQLDAWRALATPADLVQRRRLANQLLQDLPEQVRNGDYDLALAQLLQRDLLQDAVSDPVLRAQRAMAEARRLTEAVPRDEAASS